MNKKLLISLIAIGVVILIVVGVVLGVVLSKKDDTGLEYTIIFDSNGGNSIPNQTIKENGLITKPTDPIREGYDFVGWYLEDKKWDFTSDKVTGNITLKAKWQEVGAIAQSFTITFNSNGGSNVQSQTIKKNNLVEEPQIPIKEGFIFLGWYNGETEWNFASDRVTENITLTAKWEEMDVESLFTFTLNDDNESYSISKAEGKTMPANLTIPRLYQGKPVTTIGMDAFTDSDELVNLIIPNSIVTIGENGFWSCSNLKSVTFETESKLEEIGAYAFQYCTSLESIAIPKSVTGIGNYAISKCSSLKTATFEEGINLQVLNGIFWADTALQSVTIPRSVTTINAYTFNTCSSLTTLTFEENSSLESIGDYAFQGCGLESIELPNSLTIMAQYAISKCPNLKTVTFEEGSILDILEDHLFWQDTALENIVIPESIKVINGSAFKECSSLESITIPKRVTTIGANAFLTCSSLTTLTFEKNSSLESIGEFAFQKCGLESIAIPKSVKTMAQYAISKCPNLTAVTFEDGIDVRELEGVFWQDTALQSVTIPRSVTIIKAYTFSECDSLTQLYIPNTVTTIKADAFKNSDNTSLYFETEAEPSNYHYTCFSGISFLNVAREDYTTIDNIQYLIRGTEAVVSGRAVGIQNANIKSSVLINGSTYNVTGIGAKTFRYCDSLVSVTIPSSITKIEKYAISYCDKLESITIPTSVNEIGEHAFYDCSSLKNIVIPSSVTTMGISIVLAPTMIYANVSSKPAGWDDYFHGGTSVFYNTSPSDSVTIDNIVYVKQGNSAVVGGYIEGITKANILDKVTIGGTQYNVTSVADYALRSSSITSLTLPNTITSIGAHAFEFCQMGTSLVIPDSVTTIKAEAFDGCQHLESIYIPSSVTTMERYAFGEYGKNYTIYCEAAEKPAGWDNYWISNRRPAIFGVKQGDWVLVDDLYYMIDANSNAKVVGHVLDITNVVIPRTVEINGTTYNVTSINELVFCDSDDDFVSVIIPKSVTTIGQQAFQYCTSLVIYAEAPSKPSGWYSSWNGTSPYIAPVYWGVQEGFSFVEIEGIQYLLNGTEAIVSGHSDTLTDAVIPEKITVEGLNYTVTSIGVKAFSEYSDLKSVTLPSTLVSIGDKAFYNTGITSIFIPKSVKSIGDTAVSSCYSLTSVTFEEGSALQTIGSHAFFNNKITSVTIPKSVTSIGDYAFGGNSKLQTLIFEEGIDLKVIPSESFRNTAIRSLIIPKSVTSIDKYAFWNCGLLTSVTFEEGSNLTSIGSETFGGCWSLPYIFIPSHVTTIDVSAFAESDILTIYCETASAPTGFKDGWNKYGLSEQIPTYFGVTQNDFVVKEGIQYLKQGTTAIVSGQTASLFGDITILDKVEINGSIYNVTKIGTKAFYYSLFDSIVIPEGVTEIEESAFELSDLESVTLPNTLTTIGRSAFGSCGYLTDVTLPKSLKTIDSYAFNRCGLINIVIPRSVTTMGYCVFLYNNNLTKINCEASSKPTNWQSSWNEKDANPPITYYNVYWGYTG